MEQVADRFGVTRQRVSMLLRKARDGSGARLPRILLGRPEDRSASPRQASVWMKAAVSDDRVGLVLARPLDERH